MKNTIKFMIGLLAIGLVSCEPEFENAVTDEGFYDAGDADFSNYVALGNSITAGYADRQFKCLDKKILILILWLSNLVLLAVEILPNHLPQII